MAKLLNVFILVVLTTLITMALSLVSEERPWKACNQSSHCLRDCYFGGCCVNNTCDCAYLWDGYNNCPDYYYRGSREWYRLMYKNTKRRRRPNHDAAWRRYHPYNGYQDSLKALSEYLREGLQGIALTINAAKPTSRDWPDRTNQRRMTWNIRE